MCGEGQSEPAVTPLEYFDGPMHRLVPWVVEKLSRLAQLDLHLHRESISSFFAVPASTCCSFLELKLLEVQDV